MAEEDSFEKVKKGLKETGEGLKDGVEETAEAVKEGVEDTVEVVADTTEDVKEGVEQTADVFEDTAKDVTDATSSDVERKSREFNEAGKEPMNPEDIASHEPTAVKRDKKQGTSGDPV